jgi:hypothetical protein
MGRTAAAVAHGATQIGGAGPGDPAPRPRHVFSIYLNFIAWPVWALVRRHGQAAAALLASVDSALPMSAGVRLAVVMPASVTDLGMP